MESIICHEEGRRISRKRKRAKDSQPYMSRNMLLLSVAGGDSLRWGGYLVRMVVSSQYSPLVLKSTRPVTEDSMGCVKELDQRGTTQEWKHRETWLDSHLVLTLFL